jgi:class 3 adenylate cyclase
MPTAPERKLITILAADVAGYSALMERDEPGTLTQLKASRELMAEEIARHRGRVFGAAGDSLLAEFPSVVNAVEGAVRIQRRLAERNARRLEEGRMRFRIGINLGDVLIEGDDLFGEGVNIAARLQALAEPGGILISGAVFEQVRTKLSLAFDALGPQPVKNIAEPVTAWRVVLDPDIDRRAPQPSGVGRGAAAVAPAAQPVAGSPTKFSWRRLRRSMALVGVFVAFFLAINLLTYHGTLWFQWPTLGILFVLALRAAWVLGR